MTGVKSPTLKKLLKAETKVQNITPRLLHHLAQEQDNSSLTDTRLALELVRLSKQRQVGVSGSDRSGAWHPSQLHGCQRAQVFQYMGVPPKGHGHPPELINLFNDGTWRHMRWQITLLRAGIITRAEVKVWVPQWNMSGHIDGVNDPELWALELKGTASFASIVMYGVPPHHMRQMHGYFFGMPQLESFSYLAEDKTTNRWEEIVIRPEPKLLKIVEGILNDLNEAIVQSTLPDILEECLYGEGEYKKCEFAYLCKQVGHAEAEAASGCSTSEEVIVKLGLTRRNKHKPSATYNRRKAKNRSNELGTAKAVGTSSGTLHVRLGVDG